MRAALFVVVFAVLPILISCGSLSDSELKASAGKTSLNEKIDAEFARFKIQVDNLERISLTDIMDLSVESQMKFTRLLVSRKSWSSVKTGRCLVFRKNSKLLKDMQLDSQLFELTERKNLAYTKAKDYTVNECQDLNLSEELATLFYAFY